MTTINPKKSDWQMALANLITDPQVLFELLELDQTYLAKAYEACALFPLKVTHSFVARMQKGHIHDPLLLQVLPLFAEFSKNEDFTDDALKEADVNPLPGLLHKYHGRILLTLTGSCAVNCRFCFRRNFPYEENTPGNHGLENICDYIAKDGTISEIILSGGDPLNVSDQYLKTLLMRLAQIEHVKRVRIHTRLPIVLPERITPELINILNSTRLKTVIITHCNHPNEIDHTVTNAINQLNAAFIPVLNQTVLLNGINDDPETLSLLSEKLFALNIIPYYLHLPDKVNGTSHFYVSKERAKQIYQKMMNTLPGYLVPKLAEEVPGMLSKKLICS